MILSLKGVCMRRQPIQCDTPLSLAIALLGSACSSMIHGTLGTYSASRQTIRFTNLNTGATADILIARAATAASSCTLTILSVTTPRMRRRITTVVRAFVRETQAPLNIDLALQAA